MSSLLANDVALIVNKRTIRNLAISTDHQWEQAIGTAVFLLNLARFADPYIGDLLDYGLEHQDEVIGNVRMVVPRTLYATSNNLFGAIAGSSDQEKLLKRLRRFDEIAAGPVAETLEKDADINGIPLENPCPIVFKADPNKRFTFLRTSFFANNAPSFLDVVNNGLVVTIQGNAYRGDHFSRYIAENFPSHQFEMKLRYEVEFVNNSDLNLGPVPFQMVADPPAPTTVDGPSLPAKDLFVFANPIKGTETGFLMPALIPDPDNPGQFKQPSNVAGQLFLGQLDDELFETADGSPVYRVEPRSDTEPLRFVIRKIGDGTILAEARAGRMFLRFKEMVSLTFTPDSVSAADKTAIGNSLCKIQPVLAGGYLCPEALQGDSAIPLSLLSLLGPTSLDIPLLPRAIVVPVDAVVVDNGNKPGPQNSVWSSVTAADLDTAVYFADPDSNKQAFGVSGTIANTNGSPFANFSGGSDFAIGVSQSFIQPMLDEAGKGIKDSVLASPPPGLDAASVQVSSIIGDDVLRFTVTGSGEVKTPWPLPDIGYDFTAKVRLRFRAQKLVVVDGAGNTRDRFNCVIPQEALDAFDLDIGDGRIELAADKADRNPLNFRGYSDPDNGIACYDNCPEIVRLPAPVYDASVNEIVVSDPDNPPSVCNNQGKDDVQRLGQASFDSELNPSLKPDISLLPIPPVEDEDFDLEVDVSIWAMILTLLLAALSAGLLAALGVVGIFAASTLLMVVLVGVFLLPFRNIIISPILEDMVRDTLDDQKLAPFSLDLGNTSFIALHLENPSVLKPFAWEPYAAPQLPGAFITRYHAVIQAAGPNEGL